MEFLKRQIIWILFVVCCCQAYNPVLAQFSDKGFESIPVVVDGEVITRFRDIAQDGQGYMWLLTSVGLIKFDGYTYDHYRSNPADTNSVPEQISLLFVDLRARLWLGTSDGLARYDKDCDCFIRFPLAQNDSTRLGTILAIVEDQQQQLYIATEGGRFFKSDSTNHHINPLEKSIGLLRPDEVVSLLLADHQDRLWIGIRKPNEPFSKNGGGILRFNLLTGDSRRFLHESKNAKSIDDNRITCLYKDQAGRILMGGPNARLYVYDESKEIWEPIVFDASMPDQLHAPYSVEKTGRWDPYVSIIHQDSRGGFWIGTSGKGINYFDPYTGKRTFYPGDGLNSNNFFLFFEDRESKIWISTLGDLEGLSRKDPYQPQIDLNPFYGDVLALYQSPHNSNILWIGSREKGLIKLNTITRERIVYEHSVLKPKSIRAGVPRAFFEEDPTTLWIGFNEGLDKMDIQQGSFEHKLNSSAKDPQLNLPVYGLCADQDGTLWIAAGPLGVFRSNKDKTSFQFVDFHLSEGEVNAPSLFYTVWSDAYGTVLASDYAGDGTTYQFNRATNTFDPFLTGFAATNAIRDRKDWLWISTWTKGILHLNPLDKSYDKYTRSDGLLSIENSYIIEGDEDVYYVSARGGASKIDLKNDRISSVGLPTGRYNYTAAKSDDGTIFIGSIDGLVSFNPKKIDGNPFSPVVIIERILVSEEPIKVGAIKAQNTILGYDQNDISVEYTAIHFTNSSKNKYRYQLTPVDAHYVDAGTERIARYPNLAPGTYRFQLEASNSDGLWSEQSAEVNFTINPPWWKTWWASLSLILLIAGAIYGFVHYRARTLISINKDLEKNVAQRTATLTQKSEELEHKSNELEHSLENLKSTQAQLIQSEKMASLGELTAGIAHEIQNPLNFVNNFSELNEELIAELRDELKKGNWKEVENIVEDLFQNEEKIKHHGKRAESIVRNMLQHSRTSSGQKEPTDINALCDEYLRLAYHGMRAKDKSFNADYKTEFDEHLPKVNVIPQDIGRVILNLVNNAFQALSDMALSKSDSHFKPLVSITTKLSPLRGKVSAGQSLKATSGVDYSAIQITISDNGPGIPENIKDKIFQPFFTTKPAGQGTGLGLSLSYDIVKAHGGEIKVESKEGIGTEFIIQLPV